MSLLSGANLPVGVLISFLSKAPPVGPTSSFESVLCLLGVGLPVEGQFS